MNDVAAPTATAVKCLGCGASITLRALGQSVMVVCESCRTHIDISRPEIRIIKRYQQQERKLLLPLGTRGTMRGETFEVIGALQRSVLTYRWEEYLLFNPYKGFRWLVHDSGHWSFAQPVKDMSGIKVSQVVRYKERTFKRFTQGSARVQWVVGEFYWRVTAGDKSSMHDFIAPPFMLCRETDQGEITWTLLEYVEPEEIAAAFRIATPEREGIAACQPSPASRSLRWIVPVVAVAVVAAIIAQIVTVNRTRETTIPVGSYYLPRRAGQETQVYGPFTFTAPYSLNELTAVSPGLRNNWIELDCELVNTKTGQIWAFSNAYSYWSGQDSDGYWYEGSDQHTSLIPNVPAGTYNLVVEGATTEWGLAPLAQAVHLTLTHNVAPWRNFWLAMLMIATYPAVLLARHYSHEKERWINSDFDPFTRD